LVVIPVPTALIDFAFPVTFAIGFLGLVASVGSFFWTSLGGFTWGTSGVVWMPSEDINRLEFDCIVFGMSFVPVELFAPLSLVVLHLDLGWFSYSRHLG
jgi:hypothetical protein